MKPRKLAAAPIKRISLEVAEIAGKLAARSNLIAAASDWVDDGRKGVDYSAIRRGGQDATGPERAALANRTDDVGQQAGEFMATLERWHRDSRRLLHLAVKLGVEWTPEAREAAQGVAQRSAEAAGAGECSICTRPVSGSRIDRLRAGRCSACARYFERNARERPRALWGSDSIDDRCVNVRTHLGIDQRCSLPAGHEEACVWAGTEVVA